MQRRTERRTLRALGVGTVAAAALVIGGGQAVAAEDIVLDFNQPYSTAIQDSLGQGTGFTTRLGDPDPLSTVDPTLLLLNPAAPGTLTNISTTGDATTPANLPDNQNNAIGVTVDPSAGPYRIDASLIAPYSALTAKDQSFGIYVGTDQQHFVKNVMQFISNGLINEPRPRIYYENAPAGGAWATKGGIQSLPLAVRVKLRMLVNPATGEVRGYVSTNDQAMVPIHTADLPTPGIAGLNDPASTKVTAGIISHHPEGTPAITGVYDEFIVDMAPKLLSITPAQGAGGVAGDANMTVVFDQAVDPASAQGGITLTGPSGPVSVTVTLSADGKTATVDPSANLGAGSYTLNVATSVTDKVSTVPGTPEGGLPLAAGGSATFTVGGGGTVTPPPTGPGTGNNNPPPTTTPKPAYCGKFPKIRTTLNNQLKAAKKARVKAKTKAARAKAAKKIKTIKAAQKKHNTKFKATCRVGSARR